MKQDAFRSALANLLDKTNIMYRDQWAAYLFVSEPAISQWVNGQTIPRPDILNNLLTYLENFETPVIRQTLEQFYTMADQPVAEVMPEEQAKKIRRFRTVSDYVASSYMLPFQVEFSDLPAYLKRDYVFMCTEFCRSIKAVSSKKSNANHAPQILKKALQRIEKQIMPNLLQEAVEENIFKSRKYNYLPMHRTDKEIRKIAQEDTSTKHILYNLYPIEKGDRSRLEILFWTFDKALEETIDIKAIDAEEILIYKIKGAFSWTFDEHSMVDLCKNNIARLKSAELSIDKKTVSGFPSSSMKIHESGYAIVILYNERGVTMEKVNYPGNLLESVSSFSNPSLVRMSEKQRSLLLEKSSFEMVRIPEPESVLMTAIEESAKFSENDGHEKLRAEKALQEAWFHNLFGNDWNLNDSIFILKLIHFKPENAEALNKKDLIRHYGAEIVIPLYGECKLITTGTMKTDTIKTKYAYSQLGPMDTDRLTLPGLDCTDQYPNILVLDSETPHTFIGHEERGAICLHIKVRRYSAENAIDSKFNLVESPVVKIGDSYSLEDKNKQVES